MRANPVVPEPPGDTVPRAKRTDRAEARRRYRASFDAADDIETADAEEASTASRPAPAKAAAAPTPRPSIATAFRTAFHPLTLREDLRLFPTILRDKSVWIPVLIIAAVAALFVATAGQNSIAVFAAYYFLLPPAMGPAFIGGFLAPRASYLVGFVLGIASALGYLAVVASSVSLAPEGAPTATPVTTQDQLMFAFTSSPLFGIFFAAAAAWYRRFLHLSNPNRGRRQQQQQRGNDGRSRSKGPQARASSRR
jgi:hypothetical protein